MKKTDKVTELRRPQTPKAPFPYKVVEVSYQNKAGGVTLAGTLTEPEGHGPFPAVILISGSGAQDRDETIFEHKPFLVLADTLTRRGIAVLRVDDRGVGGSTGSTSSIDQRRFRRRRPGRHRLPQERGARSTRKRIGLMGHSEGGIIAPMVAARSTDVAFIVLLAGTGLPGEEILYLQGQAILKAMGAGEKALKTAARRPEAALRDPQDREGREKALETKMRDVGQGRHGIAPRGPAQGAGQGRCAHRGSAQDGPDRPGSATSSPTTRGRPWRRSTARSWRSSARRTVRYRPGRTCPRSSRRSGPPATTGSWSRNFRA